MTDPALTRRQALAGAAIGGLSLPVLAACGASSGGSAGGGGGGPGSNVLVATKDVPVGGGVVLADQNVVVTRPDKGTFEGFSATCTHQGCTLANVAAGTINCGCHGSQFSITNGANVTGPLGSAAGSVAPLPRVSIKVKGANVIRG